MKLLVITPTFNCANTITRTVACLKKQETNVEFHCILIDDCSTDDTLYKAVSSIGNDSRFTIIKNSVNLGAARNMNFCDYYARINAAKYEYIFNFGHKDHISSNFIEETCNFLDQNQNFIAASGKQYRGDISDVHRPLQAIQSYDFFEKKGIHAFVDSAINLVDCTIYNCIYRSTLYNYAHWLPAEPNIWGHDHIFISTISYFGRIKILPGAVYTRDEPANRDSNSHNYQLHSGLDRKSMVVELIHSYLTTFDFLLEKGSSIDLTNAARLKSNLFSGLVGRFFPYLAALENH